MLMSIIGSPDVLSVVVCIAMRGGSFRYRRPVV
jgi:hypothetical protein